ncbi:MAG TPA: hypothetical protein VF168_02125 [Trueperaceae bacterium]
MPETPPPDAPAHAEHPRVAAALGRARATLVLRPPATAPDVAQGVLFPVLASLGVEVFDLERLRLTGEVSAERLEYRLSGQRDLRFVVLPVDSQLPEPAGAEVSSVVYCNGRQWRHGGKDADLFEEGFAQELKHLIAGEAQSDGGTSAARSGGGRDTGERSAPVAGQRTEFVPADPFERITGEEVRRYAEAVRNMRGKLQVSFDGEPVEITSRSAFYYVLAELALRHGRADAIPGEDLVLPPDEAPAERRARPLARPGWQLLVDHEPSVIEQRTLELLDALGLRRKFSATQRGQPYPVGRE